MKLIQMLTRDNGADKEHHTKNFSFNYTNDKGWRLAPAYDLTYSDTYWGEQTTSVCGKGKDISDQDLIKVGNDAGLSKSFCVEVLKEIGDKISMLDSNGIKPEDKRG